MTGTARITALLALSLVLCAQVAREVVRGRRARGMRRRVGSLLVTPDSRTGRPPPRKPLSGKSLSGKSGAGWPPWVRRWAVPLAVGLVGWALLGGLGGLCAGVLVACGARWRRSGRRPSAATGGEEAARHLPLAADLLAACCSAGAGPGAAAEAVGRSLGGPLGERLTRTAAELRLGGEPTEVWRRFGAIPGAEGLARCMERAGSSGAPAAEAVARHAAGLRAARARTAEARARRAQVLISAPVGLCFLPAFLAVGVAPVVIGLAAGLMDR
ncbi:type II secretion system F family protein [Streptomyces sp. NPDC059352]|uniref:type II secretion system F family protein n=1 Tax=Streptomyces sp. NPDC059352 TaxID=3346810 RepID=UPI0036A99C90